MGEQPISSKSYVLIWLWESQKEYHLTKVALKYLPVPSTQIASERLLYTAGNEVISRRDNLLLINIERHVPLYKYT